MSCDENLAALQEKSEKPAPAQLKLPMTTTELREAIRAMFASIRANADIQRRAEEANLAEFINRWGDIPIRGI